MRGENHPCFILVGLLSTLSSRLLYLRRSRKWRRTQGLATGLRFRSWPPRTGVGAELAFHEGSCRHRDRDSCDLSNSFDMYAHLPYNSMWGRIGEAAATGIFFEEDRNSEETQTMTSPKTERLEARLTIEQRALIEHAAAVEGRSISEFVVGAAQAAAREVIEKHEIIRLTESQSRSLVESLLASPPPNGALRRAKAAHDSDVLSQ